jgi:plastocyanin
MNVRSIVSIATVALAAAALAGCPSDDQGGGKPTGSPGPKPAGSTKPASTGTASAAPTGDSAGGDAAYGKGVIKGVVSFSGEAPAMKVPKKRATADFCKDKQVNHNAVMVKDGKLKDVFVGIDNGQLKGQYEADKPATVDQKDCMYEPRMAGLLVGQEVQVKNSDATMHNVNAGRGTDTLFNQGQPKDSPAITKTFDEPGLVRFQCDVHSWMRSFAMVMDNPFFAISGEDGSFKIEKVPDGKYKVVAWHSQFGKKEQEIEVKGGEVEVKFEFDGTEEEPAENKGELNDLF